MEINKHNLYEMIQFFGSMRQSLAVSAGMKAVENAVIHELKTLQIFGDIVEADGKKHYLEVSDTSRKTGTYELDAMFETDDTITLVDVKPSSHDNSTPAQQHANKFKDALTIFQSKTDKKVQFVFAVYGNMTQADIDAGAYYQTMNSNGIQTISMKDLIGFDPEVIKQELMVKDIDRLVKSSQSKNNTSQDIVDEFLSMMS